MGEELHELTMPHLGVSVTEGTVTSWFKRAGDACTKGEAICAVATDKVDTDIPAPVTGRMHEIVAEEGAQVDVGGLLALIAKTEQHDRTSSDDDRPSQRADAAAHNDRSRSPDVPPEEPDLPSANTQFEPDPAGAQSSTGAAGVSTKSTRPQTHTKHLSSPLARRRAAERGIEITSLNGTGPEGAVLAADVAREVTATETVNADGEHPAGYEDVPYDRVAHSRIRKLTAEHMACSRQTSAHMTTTVDVDMSEVVTARTSANDVRQKQGKPRLSFLPYIIHATCASLARYPELNATFLDEALIQWGEINMGIAVDTPRGLLVPVIRRCERLNVGALGDEIFRLASKARDGSLDADNFRAGTFTVTNPGSVGATTAMAIINQPQVAILGVPMIVKKPVVVDGPDGSDGIGIRPIVELALTFDHRAVDGAAATRCLVEIKRQLETVRTR